MKSILKRIKLWLGLRKKTWLESLPINYEDRELAHQIAKENLAAWKADQMARHQLNYPRFF